MKTKEIRAQGLDDAVITLSKFVSYTQCITLENANTHSSWRLSQPLISNFVPVIT